MQYFWQEHPPQSYTTIHIYPTKLEQRKMVSWDGWTLLQGMHISAVYTDKAVIQTATIFPAFEKNLEEIR
jgi:hypothetical protein